MIYEIYAAIKQQLTSEDTDELLKGIEWYNVQYEATISTTPRVFVEFPEPLKFDQLSKDARRTPVHVRLHVVTQALPTPDGVIADDTAYNHETTAEMVRTAIDGLQSQYLASPLRLSGWQHWHKYKGWMVTFVEFTANKMV